VLHFPVPDPAYTHAAESRAHLRLAVRLACGFVVLLWLIQLMNWGFDVDPDPFGVRPREAAGIAGIFFAPLVHAGFMHLIANTLPLVVLGSAMLFLYPQSALRVLPVIYLAPGLVVWLFGRSSVHLGASGLIYGLAAYVFVAGLLRRDRRAIAASLIVSFMYGSLALGSCRCRRKSRGRHISPPRSSACCSHCCSGDSTWRRRNVMGGRKRTGHWHRRQTKERAPTPSRIQLPIPPKQIIIVERQPSRRRHIALDARPVEHNIVQRAQARTTAQLAASRLRQRVTQPGDDLRQR